MELNLTQEMYWLNSNAVMKVYFEANNKIQPQKWVN